MSDVEAAKQRVRAGLAEFDRDFAQIEAKATTIPYNDVVKALNALIALLNPLSANFNIIGGTGKKDDVECVNELITGYNSRMKNVEALGARAKANMPPPQTQKTTTTQVINAPPPKAQPPPQQQQPPPQNSEPVPQPAPLQPMPANVAAALATFNGIYDSYLRLTAMDVWTGRSNDIVNRWSSFCSTQAPIISAATSMRLVPDAMNQIKDFVGKFNTFAQTLTSKIDSLQINEHQKQAILRFGPDHDAIMATFKQHINSGNRVILDSQYQIMQNLERSLRSLGIDSHPQVQSQLQACSVALTKMADVFSQLDAHARQQEAAIAQHAAAHSNQGLAQRYDEPSHTTEPPSDSLTYEQFLENLEQENELVEESFDLPVPVPPPQQPQQQGPKFCPECGSSNSGSRFCGECGFKFGTY